MAGHQKNVPAPAEAQPVVHAKYQDVQMARLQAEISQLRLQIAEAVYKDQLQQQEIATVQSEKDALQDKNSALLAKIAALRIEKANQYDKILLRRKTRKFRN
ncbi:hypothetical protein ACHAPJ_009950 [Fusarium lateritium]